MLEDLTNGRLMDLTKYAGEIYSVERDYQSVECDWEHSLFLDNLRSAIVRLEESCRYYFGNNYDVSQFLNIAHEFRCKYFNKEEETKEYKKEDVEERIRRKIIEEKQRKFKKLMEE